MEKTKISLKRSHKVESSEKSLDTFFQKNDVMELTDKSIDDVFTIISKNILNEAVYPHLTKVIRPINI